MHGLNPTAGSRIAALDPYLRRIATVESKADLDAKIEQFIREWNQVVEPFDWFRKSVAKIMADASKKAAA